MLINMKEMLSVAQKKHFAVPAFNTCTNMILKGVIEACEKKKSPVIIALHPDELEFTNDSFVKMIIDEANKTKIPVCIHLDHGSSLSDIMRAIKAGFTSVMIDASQKSFEENIIITKKIVDISHSVNISVEAELGTIGPTKEGGIAETANIIYTNSSDVKKFVEETCVDSLAIAIGTAHGLYPKDKKPELRLDILKQIRETTDIPLVLHGGSDNSDEEIHQAVNIGIQKINISSDTKTAFYKKCREILKDENIREPNAIYPPCIKEMQEVVFNKINLFNSENTAQYY